MPPPVAALSAKNAAEVVELARLGKGTSNQVAYSPDGTILAVASAIGIYLYDAQTLDELDLIETDSEVLSVAFSPDGAILASGETDGAVRLRELDGTLIDVWEGHESYVSGVVFSPDGTQLASVSFDTTARLWEVNTGELLATIATGDDIYTINSVAFSPDGNTLALGVMNYSAQGSVQLWNVSRDSSTVNRMRTLEGLREQVRSIDFSSDGTILFAASVGAVSVWKVDTGEKLSEVPGRIADLSSDGETLAVGTKKVEIYQVSGEGLLPALTLEGPTELAYSVDFSPDGTTVAAGAYDGSIRLWKLSDGELLGKVDSHVYRISSLDLSPDQTLLVAKTWLGPVQVWQMDEGKLLQTLPGGYRPEADVKFSPDGELLASVGDSDTVNVWQVSDWGLRYTLTGYSGGVASLAFSPDGESLAVGSGYLGNRGLVRLSRVSNGSTLGTLSRYAGQVEQMAFSPDGQTLATAGDWHDPGVRLWRVSDGALLHTMGDYTDPIDGLAFSPDGTSLAIASGEGLQLWNVTNQTLSHTWTSDRMGCVDFSPDGRILAAGTYEGEIHLYLLSGEALPVLKGHTGYITSLHFSSDGELLASGSYDGTVRLWGVTKD